MSGVDTSGKENHKINLLIYLTRVLLCTPEYFTNTTAATLMVGGKLGSARGKPMTTCRLLKYLPTYGLAGSQHELDLNSSRPRDYMQGHCNVIAW